MIPEQFTIDIVDPSMGGVNQYGQDLPCVACEVCGAIVVLALLDRHPHAVKLHKGTPPVVRADGSRTMSSREHIVGLVKLTEPKPPRDEEALRQWQEVALSKWRHYRDNVWPSSNDIAHRLHAHNLAKLIPYLLGMPEEAMQDETVPESADPNKHFGPDSGILPDGADYRPERIVNPTNKERK